MPKAPRTAAPASPMPPRATARAATTSKAPKPARARSAQAPTPSAHVEPPVASTPAARSPRRRGPGSITDVAGIEVGHFTDPRRPTGCTVVMAREGAVAGVDVRGAAPGTRETDLLDPANLVQQVHAILLAGGSAWGLDAASGAVRWLEEQGVGFNVGVGRLPIVPSAVLFDLLVGDMRIRPDAAAGYAACAAASPRRPAEGNVGAGTGAAVGKIFGIQRAMKGGIGTASVTVDGVTVGALVACNALGDVLDPDTGRVVAGARSANGRRLLDTRRALLRGEAPKPLLPGTNTTLGVIATDAPLSKAQAQRLAVAGQDGLARSINPVHTQSDGDTVFALATGRAAQSPGMMVLATMAAEAMARATVRAVLAAQGLRTAEGLHLPAALDLSPAPVTDLAPDLMRRTRRA
ncbi:P1 family peptidase [Curvibacter sp. HBC61]|uniref:P1 family peptidase n=1 Tax=Curvibacter cyanobacteriorum TaxID=3026422 RepID=A0ABT5N4G0_9BURK|nr:P1 family peptidase [Curvibacter sp. HBC61]MDD0840943.1 P1 family peptidase [Curvibacter sp. HBC61]